MSLANIMPAVVVDPTSLGIRRGANQQTDIITGNFAAGGNIQIQTIQLSGNLDPTTIGATSIVNGYTLAQGDLFGLVAQTASNQNGLYVAGANPGAGSLIDPISSGKFQLGEVGLLQVMQGNSAGNLYQQNTVSPIFNGTTFSPSLNFTSIQDNVASVASLVVDIKTATVNVAPGQIVALDPTNLDQVVLCDCTVNTSVTYKPYGVVYVGATAGNPAQIAIGGELALTAFSFVLADVGTNVFVDAASIGGFTIIPPTTLQTFLALVGVVSAANAITLNGLGTVAELITY